MAFGFISTKGRDGALFARMDDQHDYRGWDLWLEGGGKPGTHIINKWPDNALKVIANKAIEPNRWTYVCVTYDGSSQSRRRENLYRWRIAGK